MKKNQYTTPLSEVVEFRFDLMKMTGPASVPEQAGAPSQRSEPAF